MQAVYEYENGEIGTTVGLQGFGREIVEQVLQSHDVVKVWLLQDGEDPELCFSDEPAWALEVVWVFRADGERAKVYLGCYCGEDFWSAMERVYPESCDHVEDEAFEPSCCYQYSTWDDWFRPGDDEDLSRWLQTARAIVVDASSGKEKVVKTFEAGDPDTAAGRARDFACEYVEGSGCDTSEMKVWVEVGGDVVWEWED